MNRAILLSLFGLALMLTQIHPAFAISEYVVVQAPKRFEIGNSSSSPNMVMLEFVPKGQTVRNWEELITVQTFRSKLQPTAFLNQMLVTLHPTCGQLLATPVSKKANTPFKTSEVFIECRDPKPSEDPKVTTKPIEVMAIRAIRGVEMLHVVQWAWHGDKPEQGHPSHDETIMQEWNAFFERVHLRIDY